MREYLKLTRAHTAPLETVPAILGALLATKGEITWGVILWGIAGLLYHLSGYGMNSYVDWNKGYDKEDPYKKHHPLNTGELTPNEAELAVAILLAATLSIFFYLSFPSPEALVILIVGVISGVAYNEIGKETPWKFLLISFAHTSVFILPYVSLGGSLTNEVFIFSSLYVLLWIMYQISVSGEIKDIMQDEANFLKDYLGVKTQADITLMVNDGVETRPAEIWFSNTSQIYSVLLKTGGLLVGGFLYLYNAGLLQLGWGGITVDAVPRLFVWGLLVAHTLVLSILLVSFYDYHRTHRLRWMAAIEMLTLLVFILIFEPIIGVLPAATLMIMSVLWIFTLNRIEWGTWLKPDV